MREPVTSAAPTARGRASRERIVRSAARLMLSGGVAATSVDDVLAGAAASKSQLYHYFASKHDLTTAVIDHARTIVLATQQDLADLTDWSGLQRWSDQIVDLQDRHATHHGCPLGTLAAELAAADDGARELLADAFAAWEALFRRGLDNLRHRGLLADTANLDHLATATMASLQGGLLLAKTTHTTRPLRIALDAALAHIRTFATPIGRHIADVEPHERTSPG